MIRRPQSRHTGARSVDLDGAARLMEKRAIIAALLMAGLLILYQTLFFHPSDTPPPPSKSEAPVSGIPAPPSSPLPVPPSTASAAPVPVPLAAVPLKMAPVLGPLFKAQVSSHGGDLAAWDLEFRGTKPMIVANLLGPRGVTVERAGQPPRVVDFTIAPDSVDLAAAGRGEITLVGEDGFGLRITQILSFRADDYSLDRRIRVENRSRTPQEATIVISWTAPVTWPKDVHERFQGQHPRSEERRVGKEGRC